MSYATPLNGMPPPDTQPTDSGELMAISLPKSAFGLAMTLTVDL